MSVTILRDTGAALPLLLDRVLELPEFMPAGLSALLKGLGSQFETVPLYAIYFKYSVLNGLVTVGVVLFLQVEGDFPFR